MHSIGTLGTSSSKTAENTLSLAVTDSVPKGDAVLVWAGWDNRAVESGEPQPDARFECTDDRGNTWVLAVSGDFDDLGVGDGAHCMIFFSVIDNSLAVGDVITITDLRGVNQTPKAMSAHRFGGLIKRNLAVAVGGMVCPTGATTNNPAALTLSGLRLTEYILAHVIALEAPVEEGYTQDTDYTSISFAGTTGGTKASNISVKGGYQVDLLDGDTCDVSLALSTSMKQGLVALYETNAPGVRFLTTAIAEAGVPNIALRNGSPYTQAGDVVLCAIGHQPNRFRGENAQSFLTPDAVQLSDVWTEFPWFRAGGAETQISGGDLGASNLLSAVILYGCSRDAYPVQTLVSETAAADTAVSVSAGVTDHDESLVCVYVTHGIDLNGGQVSGWTNANLTDFRELFDDGTLLLNGVGQAMAAGVLDVAGSTGVTTATLSASDNHGKAVIAVRPKSAAESNTPWVEKLGVGDSTANVTVTWDSDLVDTGDLLLVGVMAESISNAGLTIQDPTGYTEFDVSPQDTNDGTTGGCQVAAFYRVADGTETSVTVVDAGDHTTVAVYVVKNVDAGGRDAANGGASTTASTSLTMPGVTTTRPGCIVCFIAADSTDTGERQVYDMDNPNLLGLRYDESRLFPVGGHHQSASGRGGGLELGFGVKAAPGASGDTTASLDTSSKKAWIVLAFAPKNEDDNVQMFQTQLVQA